MALSVSPYEQGFDNSFFGIGNVQHSGELEPKLLGMGERKKAHATFGRPSHDTKPKQANFLRSKSRNAATAMPEATVESHAHTKERRKEPVPCRSEQPQYGLYSTKDYVRANAIENILAEPKKRDGNQQSFMHKRSYGKVPKYLKRVQAQSQYEKEHTGALSSSTDGLGSSDGLFGPSLRALTDAERDELVYELKLKWERVNEAYQKLPFTIDTPQRKARKEHHEAELKQLENDIEALQNKAVVIAEGE